MNDLKKAKKESYILPPSLDLNLPDDPEFVSTPPGIPAVEMAKICEAMLPYWNKRRFIDGFDVNLPVEEEFVL